MTYTEFTIPQVLVAPFLCLFALGLFGFALRFIVKWVTGR